jgi:hypothetical protein
MSDCVEIYDICTECEITNVSSLTNKSSASVCQSIADWVNNKFADILEAVVVVSNESSGLYRVEVYPKNNKGLGIAWGSLTATANSAFGISYTEAGTTSSIANTADNGISLQLAITKLNYMKLKIIRAKDGIVVDFIAPEVSSNKSCNLIVLDDMSFMIFADGTVKKSVGGYITACGGMLLASQYGEKLLTKFTVPGANTLLGSVFVSDRTVSGNVPYTLNGKKYVDVGANTLYRSLALEI